MPSISILSLHCSEQILLICWIIQRCLEAVICERSVIIWTLAATTGKRIHHRLRLFYPSIHLSAWLRPLHGSPFGSAAQGGRPLTTNRSILSDTSRPTIGFGSPNLLRGHIPFSPLNCLPLEAVKSMATVKLIWVLGKEAEMRKQE